MKTILTLTLLAGLLTSFNFRALAQPQPEDEPGGPPPDMVQGGPSDTNNESGPTMGGAPPMDMQTSEANPSGNAGPTNTMDTTSGRRDSYGQRGRSYSAYRGPISSGPMPPETGTNGTAGLVLNFRNAPLDLVLNYLSDAAGFIIILETPVRGNMDVISSHPMTKDEAVDLLNSVLGRNGYAAIRSGRTLTIVSKDEAKTKDIPVIYGSDPDQIPKTDEMVTQILPVRYVDATQLLKDIQPLVSLQTTMTANEAGNSIIMTDTRANIHRVAEILRAIDGSAEGETEIRVFHLKYANPTDVATTLGQIFPSNSNTSSGNSQSPIRFGGGGGPGAFFARMAAASGNSSGQNARVQKQSQVVAVADLRTSSVVVTASKDLMSEIGDMMTQLDIPSTRDQKVFVYHLDNGDPQQALQVLQNMFPSTSNSRTTSSSSSSSSSALMTRESQNASSMGSSSSSSSSSSRSNTRSTGNSRF